jgi:hypothetical protein
MKRVNVFSPSVLDRVMYRSVCFKGGTEVPETAQEYELKTCRPRTVERSSGAASSG